MITLAAAVMGPWADLGEHVGTLIAFISALLIICGSLIVVIWRMNIRMLEGIKTDNINMVNGLKTDMMTTALTFKTDILALINKVDGRIGEAFAVIEAHRLEQAEINRRVQERQEKIREEWPKEYLRVAGPGYKILADGINRIEQHFEQFAKDCRDGNCGGKK